MDRREFGIITAIGAAGALLPSPRARALTLPSAGAETKVVLEGVQRGSSEDAISDAVRKAAEVATDFSWLSRDDSVFIKPVVNSGNRYPATTSPLGLKAVVKLLKEKGAGRVLAGDMSGIEHVKLTKDGVKRKSTRDLMFSTGLSQAANEGGAELYFPEEFGWDAFFEDYPVSGSHWKGGIWIPSILKDVDHIVLLPRTGRHAIAGTSLGMKAGVGYMRTDSRLEYHRDAASFYEKTAEINTVSTLRDKLRLTLTVADKVLATFGPDDGYVSEPEVGLVFASRSLVAHDMVSLAWLLINQELAPDSQKKGIRDPFPEASATVNRGAVVVLGGLREAMKAQKLKANDITSVWDDPVLNRAYQLWGAVPRVKLVDPSGSVPKELREDLKKRTAIPA